MTQRTFLIEARAAAHMTTGAAARHLEITRDMYALLEADDKLITHPNIADRAAALFGLTTEQRNSMVDSAHRIAPDREKCKPAPVKRRLGDYSIDRQKTGRAGR